MPHASDIFPSSVKDKLFRTERGDVCLCLHEIWPSLLIDLGLLGPAMLISRSEEMALVSLCRQLDFVPVPGGIRVDPHNVERVVEPESWNLHPNVPTAINMGPIVAVKVHRLVESKAALEVLRDMGLKTEERPIGRTMQDADKEAREASLIRRTVQERAMTVVLDKLAKHKNCTEKALQLALSWLAQDAGFETKKAILRARGLDPKEAHTAFGAFMAGVKPADHAALALEIALWSGFYNCFHGASKLLTETSEVLRVDLAALEKTVKDERKQFWKEKQDKAKAQTKK